MPKVNYGAMLSRKLAELDKNGEKPSLLLHACCAPCSSYVLEYLYGRFDITLYFYNPNIAPEEEYFYRCAELKRLVSEMGLDVKIVVEKYDPQPFYDLAKGLEELPERGERCRRCIGLRLEAAAAKAAELGADFFTTTLTISPHKDCAFINEYGAQAAEKYGVSWLFSDFKKNEGYKRSIELSREYDLYRQGYCGCIYSRTAREKHNEK